jgi:hypothetical protein
MVSVMRWLAAVALLAGCPRVTPCEPWKGWALTALSDAPGERLEACSPSLLRWRVMPGGAASAWLSQLEAMRPDGGWRLWRRTALVRPSTAAVRVEVLPSGQDLVISLTPDPSIDVAQALAELQQAPGR